MIKKLQINSSYLLRFGFIDENSSGDFIDNIDGRYNIYLVYAENDGKEYSCIFANNKHIFKEKYFDEHIDELSKNLNTLCSADIAKALIQAGYEENIDGFIDHIDNVTFDNCGDYTYGTGVDDEPRPNDSVESFTKSYFVYTGLTTQCEAINIDSDTGKVEYMGGTYDSLAEFYGCVDEDQESIQGIRIRD